MTASDVADSLKPAALFQEGKVHQIDCLEGMRRYPDKHFDLVLTVPEIIKAQREVLA